MEDFGSVLVFILAFSGWMIYLEFFVEVKKSIFVSSTVVKLFGCLGLTQAIVEIICNNSTPLWQERTFTAFIYVPFILIMFLTVICVLQIKIKGRDTKLCFGNILAMTGLSGITVSLLFFIGLYLKIALLSFLFVVAIVSIWSVTATIKIPQILHKRIKPAGFETVCEERETVEIKVSLTGQDELFKNILGIKNKVLTLQMLKKYRDNAFGKYRDKASREAINNAYNHLAEKFS